jgi:putative transposase
MMKYNPQKHHRRTIRMKGYDYSQQGMYFITLCCRDRACLFGDIVDGKMMLNQYGRIAYNEWINTAKIRPNVELHEFVIMPNHIHTIIRITGCRGELNSPVIDDELNSQVLGDENNLHKSNGEFNSPLRGPAQTVGAIVRGYKSAVTKQLNALHIGCAVWQRNYYEHVIRNAHVYLKISEYIKNNPANWDNDSLK